jgi:hypothetical protein
MELSMLKKMLCTLALVACVFGLQAEEGQDKDSSAEILAACDSSDENCNDSDEGALVLFNDNDDKETSNPDELLACKNCD